MTVRCMTTLDLYVIRDRFENADLSYIADPANTLERGSGFQHRSAAVVEAKIRR
jgi:hypothetical protein